MNRNIKLTLEYDGTNYCGWQIQPNGITIQESLQKAIEKITKEQITVIGSGRTDSRVHALGQVANFKTRCKIPTEKFPIALNSVLPKDIAVKMAEEVDMNFHARYSAVEKEYKYFIFNEGVRSPIKRNYSCFVNYNLDIKRMRRALKYFLGTHDFKAFMSTGSSVKDTVRTIYEAEITERDNMIEITIRGNGFLYNMVRIIVGTLLDVGIGKTDLRDIPFMIESKDRSLTGVTAPPEGLFLSKVVY